jgi:threonine/homoserine/homoserine lactone efflux protein
MVTVSASYGAASFSLKLFFAGSLLTIFTTDLIKVFVANQLKRYLKPKFLIALNHSVGILLVVFGIFLVVKTFIKF